jgi:NADP-dependent 3-hydroxy acid dehydrogenase YdfG
MKIVLTGASYGLGKNLLNNLTEYGYDVLPLNKSIETYIDTIDSIIENYDVFINCEYKDKIQTILFDKVFNKWKYEEKTIVNILTSAIVFDGPNKKYIDDKKDLETKTFELRTIDKNVRVINVYPNTLESSITSPYEKLKYSQVNNIIKWVIELPHDIEIFEIGISKTKLKINNSLI